MIGNWFTEKKNRNKIILATKIAGPRCSWIREGKNCYNETDLEKAIDGSLKDSRLITSIFINFIGQKDL